MKRTHWAILSVAALFSVISAWAEPLFSPGFSSPDVQMDLGEEWRQRPIHHKQGQHADLVVILDQNMGTIIAPMVQAYAKQQGLRILTQNGTCGISSGGLMRKEIDIGSFCCPPGRNDRYQGVQFHTLGITPVYLIVHPDNPVNNISLKQARDIFSGTAYKWKHVDHRKDEALIHPVTRLHCKLRPGHWKGLLNNEDQFSPDSLGVGAIGDMVYTVAHDENAIGYEVPYMLTQHKQSGEVKRLTIDGKGFSALRAGQYPIYRTYSLTTWTDPHTRNDQAIRLVQYLKQKVEQLPPEFEFIPSAQLKAAGWRFRGDELIGAPGADH